MRHDLECCAMAVLGAAVLEQPLHHEVAERVPAEGHGAADELLDEVGDLLGDAMLQQPLEHPGPRVVLRRCDSATSELRRDEHRGRCRGCRDILLEDVVAVRGGRDIPNAALQPRNDGILDRGRRRLNGELKQSRTPGGHGKLQGGLGDPLEIAELETKLGHRTDADRHPPDLPTRVEARVHHHVPLHESRGREQREERVGLRPRDLEMHVDLAVTRVVHLLQHGIEIGHAIEQLGIRCSDFLQPVQDKSCIQPMHLAIRRPMPMPMPKHGRLVLAAHRVEQFLEDLCVTGALRCCGLRCLCKHLPCASNWRRVFADCRASCAICHVGPC
mmetsp:Transcript_88187/g.254497  ORF Transcript_88187/g.254497 Transcript_88187/m.254497 type:complete len:330 (+) Transcript_88187:1143-2132(+)